MLRCKPTELELFNRISSQFERSKNNKNLVSLIWKGYIAGIYEWGGIDLQAYERLINILPSGGEKELFELFIGKELSGIQEKELNEHLARTRKIEDDK